MKLYVGNLPYSLDNNGLREIFESKGITVDNASVIEDKMSGQSRGFGFVETPDGEQAIQALSGFQVNGRGLVVNEARPMAERSGGGGGERRGGGGNRFGGKGGGGGGGRRDRY